MSKKVEIKVTDENAQAIIDYYNNEKIGKRVASLERRGWDGPAERVDKLRSENLAECISRIISMEVPDVENEVTIEVEK